MNGKHLFMVVALAAMSTAANAQSGSGVHDGRFYEVVEAQRISWTDAEAEAKLRTHDGVHGRLATIHTPAEDAFIQILRNQLVPTTGNRTALWVNGFQEEPDGDFKWPNATFEETGYTNWQLGEPNPGDEMFVAVGQGGVFGWVDLEDSGSGKIWGYVVEYGDVNTVAATECDIGDLGCNLTGDDVVATFLKLPGVADPGDHEYVVRSWLVDDPWKETPGDPEGRCFPGQDADDMPLELTGGEGELVALTVPGWLCSHPIEQKFLVIQFKSDLTFQQDMAIVTNETQDFFDNSYPCNAPLDGAPPLQQDVVVYARDLSSERLESGFPALGVFSTGDLNEVTHGCGFSSRGGATRSLVLVGLNVDQGAAATARARLIGLLDYKLKLLAELVRQASVAGAIRSGGDKSKLQSAVSTALNHLARGNLGEALVHVQKFQATTKSGAFLSRARNWDGEAEQRSENIAFTLKVKLMLQSP